MKKSEIKRNEIRKEFALNTTCHGLSQVYQTDNRWMKLSWIAVVLTVFVILIWQVTDRIMAYRLFAKTKQTYEEFVDELQLPAITICNYNRYFNVTPEASLALNTMSFLYNHGDSSNRIIQPDVGISVPNASQFFDALGTNFSLSDFLISKSWKFDEDSLRSCRLGAFALCHESNFTPSFTPHFGQCWTFNSYEYLRKKGIQQGLHLIIKVNQDDYTENHFFGKPEVGAVFQVHPQYEPPQVNSVGRSVGVGMYATVAMHKVEKKNMYDPWGDCDPENENLNLYPVYTLSACMKECFDKAITSYCRCRDVTIFGHEDVRECRAVEVLNCTALYRSHLESRVKPSDCNCTQPCEETHYATSISYSTFPNKIAARVFEQYNLSLFQLRENFLGLSFYFDDLSVTHEIEDKAISESALLSDIGGQFGLWIGISVITICEFVQLLVRLWLTLKLVKKKADSKDKNKVREEDVVAKYSSKKHRGATNDTFALP